MISMIKIKFFKKDKTKNVVLAVIYLSVGLLFIGMAEKKS